MKLILFDFDGTLTTEDSFIAFLRFTATKRQFNLIFSKFFLKIGLYKLGLYKGEQLKREILSSFFKGFSEKKMKQLGRIYNMKMIPSIIRKDIMDQLLQFQREGDEICVVSASLDIWLKPFCSDLKVDCLCTEIEFIGEKYTGKFSTPNCNFEQKRIRVEEMYTLEDYDEVIVYGNSKGDRDLFGLADKKIKV